MLKRGFLAANTIYVCIEHNDRLIKKYLKFLNEIFKVINECEQKKKIINNLLETDVCHTGLKRLN